MAEEFREIANEFGWELEIKARPTAKYFDAKTKFDMANIAKELSDMLYVTYGFGANLGLPMDEAYEEVHRSNMSKLGEDGQPIFRSDGKILKGPNYSPADLSFIKKYEETAADGEQTRPETEAD